MKPHRPLLSVSLLWLLLGATGCQSQDGGDAASDAVGDTDDASDAVGDTDDASDAVGDTDDATAVPDTSADAASDAVGDTDDATAVPDTSADAASDAVGDTDDATAVPDTSGDSAGSPDEVCGDGVDNDGDGRVDCSDPDCAGPDCDEDAWLYNCGDGVDNDGDGRVDCDDYDCARRGLGPECYEDTDAYNCDDGVDNDRDGLYDCSDPRCFYAPVCNEGRLFYDDCADGVDNDRDGRVDCAEAFCSRLEYCTEANQPLHAWPCGAGVGDVFIWYVECHDGVNNDAAEDGVVDCADDDCGYYDYYCSQYWREVDCADGVDMDGFDASPYLISDGDVDCDDSDCQAVDSCNESSDEACQNGVDDDSDGLVDCAERTCLRLDLCNEHSVAGCRDGIDNDRDGLIDCDDDACATGSGSEGACGLCDDGLDNDHDTYVYFFCGGGGGYTYFYIDCDDSDCSGDPVCGEGGRSCNNDWDDDGDVLVDCVDPDCAAYPPCTASEFLCSDGVDNDGNGSLDCLDPNCAASPDCLPHCPSADLGSATGNVAAVELTEGFFTGSCGGAGPEQTFVWTAPGPGSYTFSTLGSTADTVLYARDGVCWQRMPELGCNDDSGSGASTSGLTLTLEAGQVITLFLDSAAGGPATLFVAGP